MNTTADVGDVITFDGYDGLNLVVKRINVWRNHSDRSKGTVCAVQHGHQGTLLKRRGDACQVQTIWKGVQYKGWVTFWFIKELKAQWQLGRLLKKSV